EPGRVQRQAGDAKAGRYPGGELEREGAERAERAAENTAEAAAVQYLDGDLLRPGLLDHRLLRADRLTEHRGGDLQLIGPDLRGDDPGDGAEAAGGRERAERYEGRRGDGINRRAVER